MSDASPFAGKSALVLDDNGQMRAILRSSLTSMGLRDVVEFSDPQSAHHHVQSHHIDVAVIDLVLNSTMNGMELANAIRHDAHVVNPIMPIIMVTGYASIAVIDQAINMGIDELVTKPLRARDLMARVDKVIHRPRSYIRTPSGYFGPDRRRRVDPFYNGPERRQEDLADVVSGQSDARSLVASLTADPFVEQRSVDESVILLD